MKIKMFTLTSFDKQRVRAMRKLYLEEKVLEPQVRWFLENNKITMNEYLAVVFGSKFQQVKPKEQ